MRIHDILREIGHERGLVVEDDGASVLGMVAGYPVLIRPARSPSAGVVSITVRTAPGNYSALKKAARKVRGIKPSQLRRQDTDCIMYSVPYFSLFAGKTKQAVDASLDLLMPLVAAHFSPPPAVCEVCGRPDVFDVRREGGQPVLICAACAETIRAGREAERLAYEAIDPDYLRGLAQGIVGAMIGAAVWAAVIILTKGTYLLLAAGVGILVGVFVKNGMKRVDPVGYGITGALVLASIFAGEVLVYVRLIYRSLGRIDVSMACYAYVSILMNNPLNPAYTVIFALTGVWIGIASLSKIDTDEKRGKTT